MAYSAPSTISTGDLCTAAIWNSDVVANAIAIYGGAMSVTSQAVGDILYASSTTQLGRIAAVATGQVLTSAGTGTAPAWSSNLSLGGTLDVAGAVTFNDAGADVDFRIETDTLDNMISIESGSFGGVGTLGIGVTDAFTNLNSWIAIKGPATTCPANEGFKRVRIATNGGAVTIPSGTSSLVATLQIDEPNITATGTVTEAASLYVSGAPTEGTSNYAFFVDAGASRLDGTIIVSDDTDGATAEIARMLNTGTHLARGIVLRGTSTGNIAIDGVLSSDLSSQPLVLNNNGGHVGIGEESPDHELHITKTNGDAVIKLERTGTYATIGEIAAAHSTEQFIIRTGTSAGIRFATNTTSGDWTDNTRMLIEAGGDVSINNALSKGSGSFKIDHPLPAKNDTHHLVHSFIEGPKADLIYRGTVTLVDGAATVDLDVAASMSTGTWVLLCRDEQVFTSNETGWSPVRGTVDGSTLTIDCEESDCTDTVSWMVVAERQDQHMLDTAWTDEEGRPIVEPLKPVLPDPEEDSPSASPSE